MNKNYPKNTKEWLKYLTIDNYMTDFQIEHRKKIIDEINCDYIEIKAQIHKYRNKNKLEIFRFDEKIFYITETYKLRQNIESIKEFWKSFEYNFQSKFALELLKETLIEEGFYSSTIERNNFL